MFRVLLYHLKYGILYNLIVAAISAIAFLLVGSL